MKIIVDWHKRTRTTIPKGYGFAYAEYIRDCGIYYPIPINYIIRYWRKCYWRFLTAFYWVGLIDTKASEEFRWTDFFRIKVKI